MIDIGANLTHASFIDDLDLVIEQGFASGVEQIIITGTNLEHTLQAKKIAENFDNIFFTAGLHPHHAESSLGELPEIFKITSPKLVACGEMGLDYYRDFASKTAQKDAFVAQLEQACSSKLPLFLHERDAFIDFYKILSSYKSRLEKFVVHCFTGDFESLKSYLDLGAYIGITGWICDKRGFSLRELVKYIPLDRLMIETDAPYLSPNKNRRNEPKFLSQILGRIAFILNKEAKELEAILDKNTKKFFSI